MDATPLRVFVPILLHRIGRRQRPALLLLLLLLLLMLLLLAVSGIVGNVSGSMTSVARVLRGGWGAAKREKKGRRSVVHVLCLFITIRHAAIDDPVIRPLGWSLSRASVDHLRRKIERRAKNQTKRLRFGIDRRRGIYGTEGSKDSTTIPAD